MERRQIGERKGIEGNAPTLSGVVVAHRTSDVLDGRRKSYGSVSKSNVRSQFGY
jgi:hypothetical protein